MDPSPISANYLEVYCYAYDKPLDGVDADEDGDYIGYQISPPGDDILLNKGVLAGLKIQAPLASGKDDIIRLWDKLSTMFSGVISETTEEEDEEYLEFYCLATDEEPGNIGVDEDGDVVVAIGGPAGEPVDLNGLVGLKSAYGTEFFFDHSRSGFKVQIPPGSDPFSVDRLFLKVSQHLQDKILDIMLEKRAQLVRVMLWTGSGSSGTAFLM